MRLLPGYIKRKVEEWKDSVYNSKYKPFKMDLYFKIGRNGNDVLAFDSVISHYTFLHVLGEDAYNLSYDHDENIKIPIPLSKVQWEDTFFFVCGWFPSIPEKTTFWTKRFEKNLLNSVKNKRVSIRQGQFRSYQMPTLYDDRKHYVIWGKGDINLIKKILPNPFWIGKKTSIGFGECEYTIKEQNQSNGLMFRNILQRPLPIGFVKSRHWKIKNGNSIYRPICPPYFGRFAKEIECWDVGTELE